MSYRPLGRLLIALLVAGAVWHPRNGVASNPGAGAPAAPPAATVATVATVAVHSDIGTFFRPNNGERYYRRQLARGGSES